MYFFAKESVKRQLLLLAIIFIVALTVILSAETHIDHLTKNYEEAADNAITQQNISIENLVYFRMIIILTVITICSFLFLIIYRRIVRTIKELHIAEQNMLTSQIEFILGATKTGVDIIDSKFNIKFVNSEWQKIYGSPEGKKCYQYFMGQNKPCLDCELAKAFETKETIVSEEILIKENNRPVQVTRTPFQDEKGNWLVAEVRVDISSRKIKENKTKKALDTLETILQGLPIGVVIVGKDKIIRQANNAALAMMNKTSDQIVGKICHQNMCPAQKGNCPVWDKCLSIDNSEKVILHANGNKIPVLKTALPITLDGEEVLLEAFVDISERKKIEEELKQHHDHLEELVKSRTEKIEQTNYLLQQEVDIRKNAENDLKKSNKAILESNQQLQEFLYIASHDLREPIRKVNAFGKLLSESLVEKLTEDEKENLDFIIDGANKMTQMVESLLEYSKVAGQKIHCKEINLNQIIDDLKEVDLAKLINQTKASIKIPALLPNVLADTEQMKLLLQNLITNGINFCQKNQKPEITITAEETENNKIKIVIADNGIGINPEFYDKIFSIFRRLHSSNKYTGAGAGLAICKKIVERHHGQISIESRQAIGSKFSFTISKAETAVLEPLNAQ